MGCHPLARWPLPFLPVLPIAPWSRSLAITKMLQSEFGPSLGAGLRPSVAGSQAHVVVPGGVRGPWSGVCGGTGTKMSRAAGPSLPAHSAGSVPSRRPGYRGQVLLASALWSPRVESKAFLEDEDQQGVCAAGHRGSRWDGTCALPQCGGQGGWQSNWNRNSSPLPRLCARPSSPSREQSPKDLFLISSHVASDELSVLGWGLWPRGQLATLPPLSLPQPQAGCCPLLPLRGMTPPFPVATPGPLCGRPARPQAPQPCRHTQRPLARVLGLTASGAGSRMPHSPHTGYCQGGLWRRGSFSLAKA